MYLFYSEKLKQPVSELISTDYYADIKLKQVATEIFIRESDFELSHGEKT